MNEREEYEKARKKYRKLPCWKWIEANFKIKTEEEWHILEKVRYSASEKLTFIAKILIEPVISGGGEYASFLERKMLSEKEAEELFKSFKEIEELLWSSTEIAVNEFSEKDYIEWITILKKRWDDLRPKIAKFCKKLSKGWKYYNKPDEQTAYHG